MSHSTINYLRNKREETKPEAQGFVKIVDLQSLQTLLHFRTNNNPISYLAFNPNGSLLFSSSVQGKSFHLYRIIRTVYFGTEDFALRLFKLHRGITNALVESVCFDQHLKWISVVTQNGTSHFYDIQPDESKDLQRQKFGLKSTFKSLVTQSVVKLKIELEWENPTARCEFLWREEFPKFEFPKAEFDGNDRCLLTVSGSCAMGLYFLDGAKQQMHKLADWNLKRAANLGDFRAPFSLLPMPQSAISYGACDNRWISQVEIATCVPIERPIWLGPQFSFQTYSVNTKQENVPWDVEATPLKIQITMPVHSPKSSYDETQVQDGLETAMESDLQVVESDELHETSEDEKGGDGPGHPEDGNESSGEPSAGPSGRERANKKKKKRSRSRK